MSELFEFYREGPLGTGHKVYGVVGGIVVDNRDPDGLGRVRVKIPKWDDTAFWARPVSWMAGPGRGAFFLPEKEDEALVCFEEGDLSRPYIIGYLWNGVDKPPEQDRDGKNNFRTIKSRSGHLIRLDDTDQGGKIEIIDKTGKNKVVIDSKAKKITLTSDGDLEFAAVNGKLLLHAKEVEVRSNAAQVKVSGGLGLEASGEIAVRASGRTAIKGATVEIN